MYNSELTIGNFNKTTHLSDKKSTIIFHIALTLGYLLLAPNLHLNFKHLLTITVLNIVWHQKGRKLILNLSPFLIIIYGYLTWLTNNRFTNRHIFITEPIKWESTISSGIIPSAWLQTQIANSNFYHQIISISNFLYLSHFFLIYSLIILLAIRMPKKYWVFITGFLILNLIGITTWLLLPVAPPWWATYFHYLNGPYSVQNLSTVSTYFMLTKWIPVAAFPSLHAAYPYYAVLFLIYYFPKKTLPLIIIPLSIGFAAILLGHHYLVDIIAGYFYATISFFITIFLKNIYYKHHKKNK